MCILTATPHQRRTAPIHAGVIARDGSNLPSSQVKARRENYVCVEDAADSPAAAQSRLFALIRSRVLAQHMQVVVPGTARFQIRRWSQSDSVTRTDLLSKNYA